MKAIISELWNTGIEIITSEDEFEGISSFSELNKFENVLVGDKDKSVPGYMPREVLIDDMIVYGSFINFRHPTGMGKVRVFAIENYAPVSLRSTDFYR
jgi:hypothetical protein